MPATLTSRLRRLASRLRGRPPPTRPAPPQTREVEVVLPLRDAIGDNIRPAPRTTLTIRAPGELFVPRKLEQHGLGEYEPDTIATFLAALEVLQRGHVFDVGANVGVFSLVAAALTWWDVTAFEPEPELAAVARAIAAQNGLRCDVEEIALGASNGEATLHLSDITDSSHSLREGFRPSTRSIQVPLETLDSFSGRTGRVPRLLKIDTEATEPEVLRGAAALLRDHRPWLICEVLRGRTEPDLMEILRPLDYRWYQITDDAPFTARDVIAGDETYRFTNWLFAPKEPSGAFWEAKQGWAAALRGATPVRTLAEV